MGDRRIALLGAGNYAWHLTHLLLKAEREPEWHFARNSTSFEAFPDSKTHRTTQIDDFEKADVCFLAINDRSLPSVSAQLKNNNRLLIHVSGGKSIDSLKGERRGVFYLPQTLTKGRSIDLSEVPICIEADLEDDLIWMENLAAAMGMSSVRMNSEQRKHLHLAAVFANNFSNHMYKVSQDWLQKNDLPLSLLYPLMRETTEKAIDIGPDKAQTGPAARGDFPTVKKHLRMLKNIGLKRLYQQVTKHIFDSRGKEL